MNAIEKLQESVKEKSSVLCVGLDSDLNKIPDTFSKSMAGLLDFNIEIINATKDLAASFKINFAFYEQYGVEGFSVLKETMKAIPNNIFTIADAKRADIGNTSKSYAKSIFDFFDADSITVNPYMGIDSLEPFFEYKNKMVFVLALTSNPGSYDFQRLLSDGKPIYKHVVERTTNIYSNEQLGFVVGATHPKELEDTRNIAKNYTFLIPGVGAQGGDIQAVLKANQSDNALINVSRAIIYPEIKTSFIDDVRERALYYSQALRNI